MHWKCGTVVALSFRGTYFGFATDESLVLTDLQDLGSPGVDCFMVPINNRNIGSRSSMDHT